MKAFARLFVALDQTTKTNVRLAALRTFFEEANKKDVIWCIALLTHRRPKRPVKTPLLHEWAAEQAGLPLWLFEETYHVVGDLAETISLILPKAEKREEKSLNERMLELIELGDKEETEKKAYITRTWMHLSQQECFVFNKLITGGFRMGVSARNLTKALAAHTGQDVNVIAHRLMGDWDPVSTSFEELIESEAVNADAGKPYPFYLAYPLEEEPSVLGDPEDWIIEDKWDGIRGQVIRRNGELFVWSRGEELVTDKYPEYQGFLNTVNDGTVIDGEIICHDGAVPLHFGVLQKRIGSKKVGRKLLEEAPVKLIAYDLLEFEGEDLRDRPQHERRSMLENVVRQANDPNLLISPLVNLPDWEQLVVYRAKARDRNSEGLMLKRRDATYKVGRKRGDWWKWKIDPLVIDAVLIYAMRGHGRRANLYTDYTFAVWNGEELVPFTKAYSGLTDKEFGRVDAFIKKNTLERFGPVRSVNPELVFEIAFEGIRESNRHKSGVALRFPRISRWREDKPAKEANTLDDLMSMLRAYG